MTLTVAIMTFNRPWYLQNCWESVRACLPGAQILVMDDRSDDPGQIATLDRLAQDPDTRILRQPQNVVKYHGNLYGNMQWALTEAETPYLMFLQDDTQLVRRMDATDLRDIGAFFAASDSHAFVSPFFFKWRKRRQWTQKLRPMADARIYQSAATPPLFHYSDICIAHVTRLRAAAWVFQSTESANIAQAAALFGGMGLMVDPVGFFCPQVPTFRNRSLSHSAAARLSRQRAPQHFRFEMLTAPQTRALRARPAATLPVAEDTLRTSPPDARRPFVFQDYKASAWLRLVHHAERLLRKAGIGG